MRNAGSFLVQGHIREVAPERMVPTEEILPDVHLPLPLVPNMPGNRWDEDHMRFESQDPRLLGDRRPLRHCALQLVPRPVHERKNYFYDAVLVPETSRGMFQAVLLGAARYIPRYAIDVSGKKPVVTELSDSDRHEFHKQGWIRMQRGTKWSTGLYLAQYILTNGLEAVRETEEVTRFVDARGERERRLASFGVIRRAVLNVVDPIEPVYERAKRQGAIRRPEPTAGRFITRHFDGHQPDYVPVLVEELLAA